LGCDCDKFSKQPNWLLLLAARKLVETAKQRNVQDDITALVIEIA
jgi:hypothetical protein